MPCFVKPTLDIAGYSPASKNTQQHFPLSAIVPLQIRARPRRGLGAYLSIPARRPGRYTAAPDVVYNTRRNDAAAPANGGAAA